MLKIQEDYLEGFDEYDYFDSEEIDELEYLFYSSGISFPSNAKKAILAAFQAGIQEGKLRSR